MAEHVKTRIAGRAGYAGRHRLRPGEAFEKVVAAIQGELGPDAVVTHNERLTDRLGHSRQFDVVIRGRLGGHDVLGVIECKDLKGKVGTPAVEAFVTKTQSLRANLKILVSRYGFSEKALEVGHQHGIRMMSLLKPDKETKGISVGNYVYARRMQWVGIRWGATRSDGAPFTVEASLEAATLNDISIWDWLLKEIYTTYNDTTGAGWHSLKLQLSQSAELRIGEQSAKVSSLEILLRREVECYRMPGFLRGRGFVEFGPDVVHVPMGAPLETNLVVDAEMTGWERIEVLPSNLPELFPVILNLARRPARLRESNSLPDLITEIRFVPSPPVEQTGGSRLEAIGRAAAP